MLKLDFRKAYDSVNWIFLFKAMELMGLQDPFVLMIRMLLQEASAPVSINRLCTSDFPIRRGVRQGCPIAPYLFLLVAEALAIVTHSEVAAGRLRGITLPGGSNQQVLAQFADDTTYSI